VHVDNLYCELAARAVEKVCPKVLCQGRKAASGKTEKPHTWPDIIHNKFINARKKNAPVPFNSVYVQPVQRFRTDTTMRARLSR